MFVIIVHLLINKIAPHSLEPILQTTAHYHRHTRTQSPLWRRSLDICFLLNFHSRWFSRVTLQYYYIWTQISCQKRKQCTLSPASYIRMNSLRQNTAGSASLHPLLDIYIFAGEHFSIWHSPKETHDTTDCFHADSVLFFKFLQQSTGCACWVLSAKSFLLCINLQ